MNDIENNWLSYRKKTNALNHIMYSKFRKSMGNILINLEVREVLRSYEIEYVKFYNFNTVKDISISTVK